MGKSLGLMKKKINFKKKKKGEPFIVISKFGFLKMSSTT